MPYDKCVAACKNTIEMELEGKKCIISIAVREKNVQLVCDQKPRLIHELETALELFGNLSFAVSLISTERKILYLMICPSKSNGNG